MTDSTDLTSGKTPDSSISITKSSQEIEIEELNELEFSLYQDLEKDLESAMKQNDIDHEKFVHSVILTESVNESEISNLKNVI